MKLDGSGKSKNEIACQRENHFGGNTSRLLIMNQLYQLPLCKMQFGPSFLTAINSFVSRTSCIFVILKVVRQADILKTNFNSFSFPCFGSRCSYPGTELKYHFISINSNYISTLFYFCINYIFRKNPSVLKIILICVVFALDLKLGM